MIPRYFPLALLLFVTMNVSLVSAEATSAPNNAATAGATSAIAPDKIAPVIGPDATERLRTVSQDDEIISLLHNGMTVIVRKVPSPVLTVRGYVMTGGIYEGKWLGGGLSHLLEHLVAGGSTIKRSEAQNRELLQTLGNNSNAYTTADRTAYFINTTPDNLTAAVDLLTDWLLGAKITPDEYAREYEVVQRELEKGKGEPSRQFYYLANLNRYHVSPARVPVIGYQKVIQGLSRDDVYSYYKLAYVPNNMVLVVAGDIDPQTALTVIQRHVDIPAGREFSHQIPDEPAVLSPRSVVATFPKLGQASVDLAFPSVRLDDPDLYALDLLADVLGDGQSSLLVEEIRDRQRLVNSIAAGNPTPAYVQGSFSISMRLDPEKISAATDAVMQIIERVKTEGISADRIERAKTQLKIARIRGLQTSESIAESMANDYITTGDAHFFDNYIQQIMLVTPEQLQIVANKYLNPQRLITTTLLPAEMVGAQGLQRAVDLLQPAHANATESTADQSSSITRTELPNGTILLHRRITTTPLVYANMYALGGLTRETAENNGIGNLVMAMLPRGTAGHDAQEIAAYWDSIGGTLDTAMGNNTWYWRMSSLADNFDDAFAHFADVINTPTFPESELKTMQQRTLAAIDSQDARWESQAFRFFREQFYGPDNSPYQFQAIGLRKNVEQFVPDDLKQWYAAQVLTSARVISIFGDISLAQARELATRYVGQGPALGARRQVPADSTPAAASSGVPAIEVVRVEVQPTQQPLAGIVIGFESDNAIGQAVNDPLDVIDTITSGQGYPTGYLHEVLRGQGLVYVVHAMNSPGQGHDLPGAFIAYAGTEPGKVNQVVDLMLQNIARVQGSDADMIPDWFNRAKHLMVINEAMQRETADEQATAAALDELYGLGYQHYLTNTDRIRAVSLDQVRRVARTHLNRVVVTISTPQPQAVSIKPGIRTYESFPPIDLAPTGVAHDSAAAD